MINRLNIRWKLTLFYGGVLAVVLMAFSTTVYLAIRYQMLQRIDQGLKEEVSDVIYEVQRAKDADGLLTILDRRFAQHQGFDFQITTPDGKRFFANARMADKSLPLPESSVPENLAVFQTVALDAGYRVVTVRSDGPQGPLVIQVARSLEDHNQELGELLAVFAIVVPLTLLATLGGGYFLARRVLSPVQRITQAAQHITASRLDQRIELANPNDELGALAATLNDMIQRLERSFQEMQRFTADAAHELRTPLTVIRTEAEVALRSPRSTEEYGRVLENLLEETNRLSHIADQLLFLCRQDAGLHPSLREPVDASQLLQDVVGHMQAVAHEKQITLSLEANPRCEMLGDAPQLRRVFYNVLDNAVKYTPRGGAVAVRGELLDAAWSVCVTDTGIGIAPQHLPHIFDRFYRADPARTGETGAGLGLSICQSLLHSMHGRIEVKSHIGCGTTVTVVLSRTPPSPAAGFTSR
jgi:heavy metal sensor kinase